MLVFIRPPSPCRLGSGNLVHEAGFADLPADIRSTYIANTTVAGVDEADVVLLVGSVCLSRFTSE